MTYRFDERLCDAPMIPVACRHCDAEVLVRKSSWAQTSVQWNAAAVSRCAVRRTGGRTPREAAAFTGCPDLVESIREAAARRHLPVLDVAEPDR